MKDDKPIDTKRNSSGQARIGTLEDGAIEEMITIGDKIIVIKERSIYEFMMADAVDPERTNINLPNNIHKLIINKGSESELVSRVLLTAHILLKKGKFENDVNTDNALILTLELIQELAILETEIQSYLNKEQEVIEEYESKRGKAVSYSIPSIGNAKNRCTTIFQKADHIEQILMKIVLIFYPNDGLTQQSHFPKLHIIIEEKYGEKDSFTEFLCNIKEFMKTIRNIRNALDHQLKGVEIYDFELESNTNVITPSIQLDFKGSKIEKQTLSEFLKILIPNFIHICEITIVHLAGRNFIPSIIHQVVKEIPEDKRWNKYIRYSYWSNMGEGGYYDQ